MIHSRRLHTKPSKTNENAPQNTLQKENTSQNALQNTLSKEKTSPNALQNTLSKDFCISKATFPLVFDIWESPKHSFKGHVLGLCRAGSGGPGGLLGYCPHRNLASRHLNCRKAVKFMYCMQTICVSLRNQCFKCCLLH